MDLPGDVDSDTDETGDDRDPGVIDPRVMAAALAARVCEALERPGG